MSKHYHSDNDVGVTDDEASKLLPNTSRATKLLVVGITVAMVAVVLIGALVAVLYSFGIVETSSPKLTYVQSVTSARMYQHLQQFQSIAAQYNNSRAVNLVRCDDHDNATRASDSHIKECMRYLSISIYLYLYLSLYLVDITGLQRIGRIRLSTTEAVHQLQRVLSELHVP